MPKDERIRNWTFILYPESALDNWRQILDDEHIPWIESPLHDMDVNADGELKKAHWHILLLYGGKKSYEQVQAVTERIKGTIPQKVSSSKGCVRYMAHLDNPEKYQYSKSGIIAHGGIDLAEYLKPTSSSRYSLIGEMIDYVREYRIVEMRDLIDHAREKRFDDWFPLLCDNSAYIMEQYIKSMRNSSMK